MSQSPMENQEILSELREISSGIKTISSLLCGSTFEVDEFGIELAEGESPTNTLLDIEAKLWSIESKIEKLLGEDNYNSDHGMPQAINMIENSINRAVKGIDRSFLFIAVELGIILYMVYDKLY